MPPSRLNGKGYEWEAGGIGELDSLPEFPADFLASHKQSEPAVGAISDWQPGDPYHAKIANHLLREICKEVAAAEEGTRNDTLNRNAFIVGQWVGAKAIDYDTAYEQLSDAAHETGLEADEIERTVTHALNDGIKKPQPPGLVLNPQDPMKSARKLIAIEFTDAEGRRTLQRHRDVFYIWNGSCYREASEGDVKSRVWTFLERALSQTRNGTLQSFKPKRENVSNVVEAIQALCQLGSERDAPFWLEETGLPPADELLACANGLLHVPTGRLLEPTPAYFCQTASAVDFNPLARKTPYWTGFLDELFGDDQQAMELVQEWFGYTLTADTTQQKILLIVGPPRSGKGTIARVHTMVLGRDSVASPTMDSLSSNFGLYPVIGKSLAIISDARIGPKTNKTAITERLLSISGEDQMTVDRKHRTHWTGRLQARICISTNELPRLNDGSAALPKRLLVIVLRNDFYGREDTELSKKLMGELSGILNWSIEGYRRLRGRGYFVQPESSKEQIEAIERLAAPVKAFVSDCCDIGADQRTPVDELYEIYVKWGTQEGYATPSSKEWFARQLQTAYPGIKRIRPRAGDGKQEPTYQGIGINPYARFSLENA